MLYLGRYNIYTYIDHIDAPRGLFIYLSFFLFDFYLVDLSSLCRLLDVSVCVCKCGCVVCVCVFEGRLTIYILQCLYSKDPIFGVRGYLQLAHNFKPSQSQIRHKKLILPSPFSSFFLYCT